MPETLTPEAASEATTEEQAAQEASEAEAQAKVEAHLDEAIEKIEAGATAEDIANEVKEREEAEGGEAEGGEAEGGEQEGVGDGESGGEGEQQEATETKPADFRPEDFADARQFGMTDEEARAYGTPENLHRALQLAENAWQAAQKQEAGTEGQGDGGKQAEAADDDPLAALDPDTDPAIRTILEAQQKQINEQAAQLRAQDEARQSETQRSQQNQQDKLYQWVDEQLALLADDHGDVFGKSREERFRDPKLMSNTMEVLNRYELLSGGGGVMDAKVFGEALRASPFGERLTESAQQQARDELTSKVQQNSRRRIGSPSGRQPTPESENYAGREEDHPDVIAAYNAALMAE